MRSRRPGVVGLGVVLRRQRREHVGQLLLLWVTAAVVVACAAFLPLISGSLSRALLWSRVSQQGLANGFVQVKSDALDPGEHMSVAQLQAAVAPGLRRVLGTPVAGGAIVVQTVTSNTMLTLQYTQGGCAHVRVVQGRCPSGVDEVMVSRAAAADQVPVLRVGQHVVVREVNLAAGLVQRTLVITGVFTSVGGQPFWNGADIGAVEPNNLDSTQTWLTASATFHPARSVPAWQGATASVTYRLSPSGLTPARMPAALAGVGRTNAALSGRRQGVLVEPITQINAQTHTDLLLVGQIMPLLMLQLGVVLAVFGWQTVTYVTDTRRRESAVLKLRNWDNAGLLRLVAGEVWPVFVCALPAGVLAAVAADDVARWWWLPGHLGVVWSWRVVVAGVAAVLVAAGLLLVRVFGSARTPISGLLRAVSPRRQRGRLGAGSLAALVVCGCGVILAATGNLSGSPALVVPTMVAIIAGIAVVAVMGVASAPAARWVWKRGRTGAAFALTQVGRRTGVVAAVMTLVVSCALVVFCANSLVLGQRNRSARAQADLGAPVVITALSSTSTPTPAAGVVQAVNDIDPGHRHLTPVVLITSVGTSGVETMAVVPGDMARISTRAGLATPVPWHLLQAAPGPGGVLPAISASWLPPAPGGSTFTAPTLADLDGPYRVVATVPYIPGAQEDTTHPVMVTNLTALLGTGTRTDNLIQMVWSAGATPALLHRLDQRLERSGFDSITTTSTRQQESFYAQSATAWTMQVGLIVAVTAAIIALGSVTMMGVASLADRTHDLQALRTAHVPDRLLRSATITEFVLIALTGALVGLGCAPLGILIAGRRVPWWASPPPFAVTATGPQWNTIGATALVLSIALIAVSALVGARVAAHARRHDSEVAA